MFLGSLIQAALRHSHAASHPEALHAAPSSGHRLPQTGSEMPRVATSFCLHVHLISSPQCKIKTPFYISFTKCCQEQNTGLSYQKACVLKAFCCHFNFKAITGERGGIISTSFQEGSFHFIAPRALPLSFFHTPSPPCLLPGQHTIMERAHIVLGVGNLGSHYNSVSYQVRAKSHDLSCFQVDTEMIISKLHGSVCCKSYVSLPIQA